MTTPARAVVALAPEGQQPNWDLQEIKVPTELKDGELLVEVVATGICHTDIVITLAPASYLPYPRVVGHEGSGYVKAIGPKVTKDVKVGDPVLLSFDHCGTCESCKTDHPAYCTTFSPLNIAGATDVFQSKDGKGIAGKCFGQSSFASLSVVNEASVLPAKDFVKTKEDLQLFAPLGCGIQTGAGAILNIAKPRKIDRVMILGLGGVGLAAIMAAKISGCQQIVAVDRVKSRLDIAKTLGATDAVDTTGIEDLVSKFKEVTGGIGPTCVVDTTGFTPVLDAGYKSLGPRGSMVLIGVVPDQEYTLKVNPREHMMNGTKLMGCCEGDSLPHEFIPRLIEHYRAGQLPIDKFIKFYKADEYKTALHDMHTGETIKPVLLWS